MKGYDSHFIIQQIGEIAKKHTSENQKGDECQMNINEIPNDMGKKMAFMLGHNLTFIYSFQFMGSSRDKLVSNLPQESFKYTSERFKRDHFDLITKKSVYPYDYMDIFDKFNKTELPTKEEFLCVLNNESITDEQYEHAQNVWKTLKKEHGSVSCMICISGVIYAFW